MRQSQKKKIDLSQFLSGVPARDYYFQSLPSVKNESESIANQWELLRAYIREHPYIELYDIHAEMKIA